MSKQEGALIEPIEKSPVEINDSETPAAAGTEQNAVTTDIQFNKDGTIQLTDEQKKKLKESKIAKEVNELLASTTEEHFKLITDELKNDNIRLEYIDKKTKTLKVNRIPYNPISVDANRAVGKVIRKIRRFRADFSGMGKEKGALDFGELQKKYPEIIDEDMMLEDLQHRDTFEEMLINYLYAQKMKIYWDIDNFGDYIMNDVVMLVGLHESRNNFNPS